MDAIEQDAETLLECQGRLDESERENANLRIALVAARRIGAALGILMASRKITDDEAFALLARASQSGNRKLRDLAEDVILTGVLPS